MKDDSQPWLSAPIADVKSVDKKTATSELNECIHIKG